MLLIARHGMPEIRPEVPPPLWTLSDRGRRQAARLAEDVRRHGPVRIVTSLEPKARETGEIVGAALGIRVASRACLHEHERVGAPYLNDPAEVRARIRALFARTEERVFGSESGAAARARWVAALHAALREDLRVPVLIVAHGTVISLAIADANGLDGFAFWERFGLGDHLVLGGPDLKLREQVRLGTLS